MYRLIQLLSCLATLILVTTVSTEAIEANQRTRMAPSDQARIGNKIAGSYARFGATTEAASKASTSVVPDGCGNTILGTVQTTRGSHTDITTVVLGSVNTVNNHTWCEKRR